MCIGVPLRVIQSHEGVATVDADGAERLVSTLLLETPPAPGDWLLIHGDRAIRTMAADEAALVRDALSAVLAAAEGRDFDHLIADLIDREPELPPHLTA